MWVASPSFSMWNILKFIKMTQYLSHLSYPKSQGKTRKTISWYFIPLPEYSSFSFLSWQAWPQSSGPWFCMKVKSYLHIQPIHAWLTSVCTWLVDRLSGHECHHVSDPPPDEPVENLALSKKMECLGRAHVFSFMSHPQSAGPSYKP